MKNLESKIGVAIDSRNGEIHLVLDDDSLDKLIKNQKNDNEVWFITKYKMLKRGVM